MNDCILKNGLIKGDLQHPVTLYALWKDLTKVNISTQDLEPPGTGINLHTAWGINIPLPRSDDDPAFATWSFGDPT